VTLWPMDGTVFLFMGKNDLYERRVCVSYLTHVQICLASEMRFVTIRPLRENPRPIPCRYRQRGPRLLYKEPRLLYKDKRTRQGQEDPRHYSRSIESARASLSRRASAAIWAQAVPSAQFKNLASTSLRGRGDEVIE
jgi:hypothetical protein